MPRSQGSSSDSDPEHALAELQAEQSTVCHAEGGACRLGEVAGQHGLGAVPGPGAAAELADVVEAGSCTDSRPSTLTDRRSTETSSVQSFSHLCPGRPPRRCWRQWAWRRTRRTSWFECTGAGRPGTSTCKDSTAADQTQHGNVYHLASPSDDVILMERKS